MKWLAAIVILCYMLWHSRLGAAYTKPDPLDLVVSEALFIQASIQALHDFCVKTAAVWSGDSNVTRSAYLIREDLPPETPIPDLIWRAAPRILAYCANDFFLLLPILHPRYDGPLTTTLEYFPVCGLECKRQRFSHLDVINHTLDTQFIHRNQLEPQFVEFEDIRDLKEGESMIVELQHVMELTNLYFNCDRMVGCNRNASTSVMTP